MFGYSAPSPEKWGLLYVNSSPVDDCVRSDPGKVPLRQRCGASCRPVESAVECMCLPSQVEARKPEWAVGAQQLIKRKAKASGKGVAHAQPPSGASSKAASAWGAFALNGDAELIDDEELLTEADLARPDVPGIHHAMHAFVRYLYKSKVSLRSRVIWHVVGRCHAHLYDLQLAAAASPKLVWQGSSRRGDQGVEVTRMRVYYEWYRYIHGRLWFTCNVVFVQWWTAAPAVRHAKTAPVVVPRQRLQANQHPSSPRR